MNEIKAKRCVLRIQFLSTQDVYLVTGLILVSGNAALKQPRNFQVIKLPDLLVERINVLKLIDLYSEIPDYGSRASLNAFYVEVTPEEWQYLQAIFIKENINEKIEIRIPNYTDS